MRVLGIESSCDETAASVVEDGYRLMSTVVASSMDLHVQYGGVVPEIAARSHIEVINSVVDQAITDAGCTWDDIDAIAVTYGPGLGGSLLIGVMTARTLAIVHNKPLYAINHVEAHVYANFLTASSQGQEPRAKSQEPRGASLASVSSNKTDTSADDGPRGIPYALPSQQPAFPLLALIVSGGHTQLALFRHHFDYTLLGETGDDAIGEAFDKVAKIIGLPYPGGPSISRKALAGNPEAFQLPKSRLTSVSPALEQLRSNTVTALKQPSKGPDFNPSPSLQASSVSYDFSFSGLKTAVLRLAQELIGADHTFPSKDLPERLSEAQRADIAASFQYVAIETVVDKTVAAYTEFGPASVVIAGGVAANQELRRQLAERLSIPVTYTDSRLCTDNGAMIATLGCFHMKYGRPTADPYTLAISPNLSM